MHFVYVAYISFRGARAPPPKKKIWKKISGGGHVPPPQKKIGKKISGNYYVKLGHFPGKNRVKFGNFVNFSGKYKNSGILIIFRARIV